MSEMRLVPRCLAVAVFAAIITACSSSHHSQDHGSGRPVCPGAVDDRQGPVICVDDTGSALTFLPDPAVIHDVKHDDANAAVPIRWFVRTPGRKLEVEMVDPDCVDAPTCAGPQCMSQSRKGQKDPKICKYNVWVDRGEADEMYRDPTVIITGCCT